LSIRSDWTRIRAGMSRSTVVSAAPLAFIVLVGALLSYRSHAILRLDRDMVIHTYQVLGAAREVMQATGEAETGERGFIITGDPGFLVPYEKARNQAIPAALADLTRLLVRNAAQRKRFARLRELIWEKFDEIQTTIQVRRDQGFEAARTLVTDQERRRAMDHIRAVVSDMDNEEEKLLEQRSRNVAVSEERILWVAAFTATLSIATRIFIAIWLRKSNDRLVLSSRCLQGLP
jgi:methyl-accepting chemotaxis protein